MTFKYNMSSGDCDVGSVLFSDLTTLTDAWDWARLRLVDPSAFVDTRHPYVLDGTVPLLLLRFQDPSDRFLGWPSSPASGASRLGSG